MKITYSKKFLSNLKNWSVLLRGWILHDVYKPHKYKRGIIWGISIHSILYVLFYIHSRIHYMYTMYILYKNYTYMCYFSLVYIEKGYNFFGSKGGSCTKGALRFRETLDNNALVSCNSCFHPLLFMVIDP